MSLTMLVDSPIISGEFFRVVPLSDNPPQEIDIAADSAAALGAPPEVLDHYKTLTDQAKKLFGAQHFRDYHFLYSLSDHVAHFGLEHHESNDSRSGERAMVDPGQRLLSAGLLSHEYVHSWNGKYRRPADLATPDYEKPMQDELLWVYEGLTSYLGDLLSARSGIRTPEQFRELWPNLRPALITYPAAAGATYRTPLTASPPCRVHPASGNRGAAPSTTTTKNVLNWLWADTIIRQRTHGAQIHGRFLSPVPRRESGPPQVKTYTFDEVVNTVNQVTPYDWRAFWTERLTNHGPGAPLDGLEASGWKLVYDDKRSELERAEEGEGNGGFDAGYSIGLLLPQRWRHRRHHRGNGCRQGRHWPRHESGCGQRAEVFGQRHARCAEGR